MSNATTPETPTLHVTIFAPDSREIYAERVPVRGWLQGGPEGQGHYITTAKQVLDKHPLLAAVTLHSRVTGLMYTYRR